MTIDEVKDTVGYFGAALAVAMIAALDRAQVEFEDPYPCEDGKHFMLRAWTKDDRSFERCFLPVPIVGDIAIEQIGQEIGL